MTPLAHIGGIPLEEAVLSIAPVATVVGSVLLLQLRGMRWGERSGDR